MFICNELHEITPNKRFLWEPEKINFNFSEIEKMIGKIVLSTISFCEIEAFEDCFLGLP